MKHFIDNDALVKLAGYDLFQDFLQYRKITRFKVFRLGTVAAVFGLDEQQLSPKLKDELHREQLRKLVRDVQPSGGHLAADKLKAALMSRRIDVGEAILISRAAQDRTSFLVTGDKAALRKLANDPHLSSVTTELTGRCIHVEQVIEWAAAQSFAELKSKIQVREPGIDTKLREIFCPPSPKSENVMRNELSEGVRNFVFVSHTIPRLGQGETYGEEGYRAIQPGIAGPAAGRA